MPVLCPVAPRRWGAWPRPHLASARWHTLLFRPLPWVLPSALMWEKERVCRVLACPSALLPTCCVTLGMSRHLSEFPISASDKCHHLIFSSAVYHLTIHRLRPTVTHSQHVYLLLDHNRSAAGPEAPQASRAWSFLACCGYTMNVHVFL